MNWHFYPYMKQRRHIVVFGIIAAGLLCITPQSFAASSPPPNDSFTNRIVLPALAELSIAASNEFATTNPGEPLQEAVWWTYTPPATGLVWVEITSPTFQSSVFAYSGTNETDSVIEEKPSSKPPTALRC